MTLQKTFTRGNYEGVWIADTSDAKSGSLRILFKGAEEIVLHDKAEHAAEQVFKTYAEPDWHALADVVFDNYVKSDVSFADSLKAIADDERHIPHDLYVVKEILKDIFAREGYDKSDFSIFDTE
jgi:hypothetical protein|tara:strand:+ start:622 stop:993 length:372 start_codon:yes stop_codon:yes gene_type:complete